MADHIMEMTADNQFGVYKKQSDGTKGVLVKKHASATDATDHLQLLANQNDNVPEPNADDSKEVGEKARWETWLSSVLDRITGSKSQAKPTGAGFKSLPDHKWLAWWSNSFEDKDKEFFPEAATDRYLARVDAGIVPMPELWYWHMPARSGKAEWLGRVDHINVALGSFDDTPIGKAYEQHFSTSKDAHTVSHGFTYPVAYKSDGAYHEYNTFEISPLPLGREANPFTTFEGVKAMPITDDKRKALEKIIGPELASQVLGDAEKRSKEIEDTGVKFKDFPLPQSQDADAREGVKALAEGTATAIKTMSDQFGEIKAVIATLVKTVDGIAAESKATKDYVKEQFALQPSPRISVKTVIDPNDPVLQQMKAQQEAGEAPTIGLFAHFMPPQAHKEGQ